MHTIHCWTWARPYGTGWKQLNRPKGLWTPLLHSVAVVLTWHHSSVFTTVPVYLCPSPPHSHLLYLTVKRHIQHGLLGSAAESSASAKDVPLCTKHTNHSHLIIKITSATQPLSLDKFWKWALVVYSFNTSLHTHFWPLHHTPKRRRTPSGFISRRSPNPFFLSFLGDELPTSLLLSFFFFFGLWILNLVTEINQLSHWAVSCSEHSINHVGPKKLSRNAADLVNARHAELWVTTIHNVCGMHPRANILSFFFPFCPYFLRPFVWRDFECIWYLNKN